MQLNHGPEAGIDPVELYKIYREYIMHEDELVNNRVGWFIQLHSFLIASYTIVISSLMSSFFPQGRPLGEPGPVQAIACSVLFAISVIGFVSSDSAGRSIKAAADATRALRDTWCELSARNQWPSCLPKIVGGGDPSAEKEGMEFHSRLPTALKILWIASLLIPLWFLHLAGVLKI